VFAEQFHVVGRAVVSAPGERQERDSEAQQGAKYHGENLRARAARGLATPVLSRKRQIAAHRRCTRQTLFEFVPCSLRILPVRSISTTREPPWLDTSVLPLGSRSA